MRSKRLWHDGNPVLEWCIGNVVGHYDARGNVYPRKQRPEQKIDVAVSTIMVIGLAMRDEDAGPSVYESRGPIFVWCTSIYHVYTFNGGVMGMQGNPPDLRADMYIYWTSANCGSACSQHRRVSNARRSFLLASISTVLSQQIRFPNARPPSVPVPVALARPASISVAAGRHRTTRR
jgi:hypothetical protein